MVFGSVPAKVPAKSPVIHCNKLRRFIIFLYRPEREQFEQKSKIVPFGKVWNKIMKSGMNCPDRDILIS
jgi:hypothetical protein